MQAVSPSSLRFSFFDGAVEVVTRNTFLDVEVVPADTQELCRTKSCPALLHYKEETHCLEFEDTKQWARLTTESTQCPEDETDPLLGLDREERQSEGGEGETDWQSVCTVMIKNIPCRCSSEEVTCSVRWRARAGPRCTPMSKSRCPSLGRCRPLGFCRHV
ncbi:unnamed protein product [Durusdinium trenchii]|uniref:Uncharacterized protein n=1 Tax=Durusdinium trenchii TaxID=1381693 RepID=A0ABP0JY01_9DINO